MFRSALIPRRDDFLVSFDHEIDRLFNKVFGQSFLDGVKSTKYPRLDVFEEEPEVYPRLLELDNVVLTPHIASGSVETRTKMATMAAENILAALDDKTPPNAVNRV